MQAEVIGYKIIKSRVQHMNEVVIIHYGLKINL